MATCGTCTNYRPSADPASAPYEGKCVLNVPVVMPSMRTREYATSEVVSTTANGEKTYLNLRLKTYFDQPDVIAELDTCGHHLPHVEEPHVAEPVEAPVASSRRPRPTKPEAPSESTPESPLPAESDDVDPAETTEE